MEKQVNKLAKQIQLKTILQYALVIIITLSSFLAQAQQLSYANSKTYTIAEITVKGNTSFSEQTIITYSGLRKGTDISIPGEEISNAVKKLWNSDLFSDIEVFLVKVENGAAYLEIRLSDLPELNILKINGVKKSKKEALIKENKLEKGQKVTENLITTTKNYIQNKNKKAGYLNTKVHVNTSEVNDSIEKARVNMLLTVDRGEKVKIKKINFEGNEILSDKKLRKAMKNTKQKNIIRVLKRSKYIEEDYRTDLENVVNKYKSIGYRDARIISDTLIVNDKKSITLNIKVEEGDKYNFGDISFVGNTIYTDAYLKRQLRIEKGDTYNGVELAKRIADESRPDGNDIVVCTYFNWIDGRK